MEGSHRVVPFSTSQSSVPTTVSPHTAGLLRRIDGNGLLRTNGEDAVVEEVRVWPGDGPQIVTAQQRRWPSRGKRREEICGTYSE